MKPQFGIAAKSIASYWGVRNTAASPAAMCPTWNGKAEIDSRMVQGADLFVALQGQRQDGRQYIVDVVHQQAAFVLCQSGTVGLLQEGLLPWHDALAIEQLPDASAANEFAGTVLCECEDVEATFDDLAVQRRAMYSGTVIAVTGSYGKTTAKEILYRVLHGSQANKGNLNNQLGVPLSLLNFDLSSPFWICELGMNHAGELTALGELVKPHIVLFTPIGNAHIGCHNSEESWIASAKTELLRTSVPPENVWMPVASTEYAAFAASYSGKVHLYKSADQTEMHPELWQDTHCTSIELLIDEVREHFPECCTMEYTNTVLHEGELDAEPHTISWDIPQMDFASAVIACLDIARFCQMPIIDECLMLRERMGDRMRIIKLDQNLWLINDAYNASPETVLSAIGWCRRRLLDGFQVSILLSDMLELGERAAVFHKQVLEELRDSGIECNILAGSAAYAQAAAEDIQNFFQTASFKDWINEKEHQAGEQKILYAKGSQGTGLAAQIRQFEKENHSA